jgi:hypothetical protein
MAKATDPTAPEAAKKQNDSNRRYTQATARLRVKYAEDFQALLEAVYAEEGATYRRRLTAAEHDAKVAADARAKAAEKMAAALALYPDLTPDEIAAAKAKIDAAAAEKTAPVMDGTVAGGDPVF